MAFPNSGFLPFASFAPSPCRRSDFPIWYILNKDTNWVKINLFDCTNSSVQCELQTKAVYLHLVNTVRAALSSFGGYQFTFFRNNCQSIFVPFVSYECEKSHLLNGSYPENAMEQSKPPLGHFQFSFYNSFTASLVYQDHWNAQTWYR